MDPKARGCFYLGPTKNRPTESKRVLFNSGKLIATRDVTWAHHTTQSKPSEEGEADNGAEDRGVSSFEVDSNDEVLPRVISWG